MPAPAPIGTGGANTESVLDSIWVEKAVGNRQRLRRRAPGDRARGLLLLGLLGAAMVVLWLRLLATEAHLPLTLRLTPTGQIELASSIDPALRDAVGHPLLAMLLPDGRRIDASAALLPRSPRWTVDDAQRAENKQLRSLIGEATLQTSVTLLFDKDLSFTITPRPRGLGGLGILCWVVSALALALYLAVAVVVLAEPGLPAALYGLIAISQCANLLLIGVEALPGLGLPTGFVSVDLAVRLLADAVSTAALVHVNLVYPHRLSRLRWLAVPAWSLMLGATVWGLLWPPAGLWWWAQGLVLAYGLAATGLLWWSNKQHGSPLGTVLHRLVVAGIGTLLLLCLAIAIAMASHESRAQYAVATVGSMVWVVFIAALLMMGPSLTGSKQVVREFAMLAGVATVACSLNLLFVAGLWLSPLTSLLLAGAVSLAVYAIARPWILDQLAGAGALSAEHMFESLYRVAREFEQAPQLAGLHLSGLLREVFDPLEVARTDLHASRIRVAADGSTMVVPIPQLPEPEGALPEWAPGLPPGRVPGAIVLRFARRGRRLFTHADILLTERLIEQLRRAVAYDRAVEQGRTEERMRIAQDLHDDIGARLLTLMYQAPNPEIEEYIRHTLQDLKTLTRGLAASNHRLSHAAAEWKADINQRLSAAGCDLHWSFSADRDLMLTVVQWSSLTRVLRELVNNIISHANATRVEINAHFDRGVLSLNVVDDGIGRSPETWSHGLGLGGVRKRVKLLGGKVQWLEQAGPGIRCEVRAPLGSEKG